MNYMALSPRKIAVLYLVPAIALARAAVRRRRGAWVLLWPAVTGLMVGTAYLSGKASLLGKRADGRLAWWAKVFLAPYLASYLLIWIKRRQFDHEPFWHEIQPGFFIGRRLANAGELPNAIDLVVDLTAEFQEPKSIRTGGAYRCVPVLDGMAPDQRELNELADLVLNWPGRVYMHCHGGHGRSAAVAAAVLLACGDAGTVREAEEILQCIRPGVELTSDQCCRLEEYLHGTQRAARVPRQTG
jgi:protein-tyrosine phosphatase